MNYDIVTENPNAYAEAISRFKRYICKHCGYKVTIASKLDKKICPNCNHYVYKSNIEEFKIKYKQYLKLKK